MWNASDEALVAGLGAGDPDVALVLVRRFQARVFGLARSIIRDPSAAEEVAQDTFVRAWRYAASFDPRRGSAAAWLLTIARNTALDYIRARDRRLDQLSLAPLDEFSEWPDLDDRIGTRDDIAPVADALRSLPPEQRDTLIAAAYYGFTAREISEAWHVPLGSVENAPAPGIAQAARHARGGCTMTCEQLVDVAPELALGVLNGRERADAIQHLDGCSACRQLLNSFADITDVLLLLLVPSVEPPSGFYTRVLEAMTPALAPSPVPPVRRRSRGAVAAIAACVAFLFGVLSLGASAPPAFAASEMRTANDEVVGWIYVDRHDTAVLHMALPGWAAQIERYRRPGDTYSLRLTERSGAAHELPVSLDSRSAWTATLDVNPRALATAALIDNRGHVWCQAELDSA